MDVYGRIRRRLKSRLVISKPAFAGYGDLTLSKARQACPLSYACRCLWGHRDRALWSRAPTLASGHARL